MYALDVLFLYNEREKSVDEIVARINQLGYKTFFWRKDVPIGTPADGREIELLERTKKVVVLLGDLGWGENHLRLVKLALEKNPDNVIPVVIGPISAEDKSQADGLFHIQRYIDLSELHAEGLGQLVESIGPKVKYVDPSAFDNFMDMFRNGNDETRAELLHSVNYLDETQKFSLATRVLGEMESIHQNFQQTIRSEEELAGRASLQSWLASLLIWTDAENPVSERLLLKLVDHEVGPDENIRFWTLAGLFQRKASYLKQAAKNAHTEEPVPVSILAGLILSNDKDTIHSLRAYLLDPDREKQRVALKVLRIFPVPELFFEIQDLLKVPELRYETFHALINLFEKDVLDGLPKHYLASQILEFIHLLYPQIPKFHLRNFAFLLTFYNKAEIEKVLSKYAGEKDFLAIIKKAVGDPLVKGSQASAISAGYTSDNTDSANDLLDIRKDVSTLTALMLSNKIDPPLAIGLFGKWGTGKSFFMDALEKECDQLIGEYKKKEVSPFHTDVVQIRFNAWNYSDSNLWASLVHHIFESLSHFVTPPKTEHEQLQSFVSGIRADQIRLDIAGEALEKRKHKLEEKIAELQLLEEARLSNPVKLQELQLEDYWEMLNPEQRTAATKILDEMGVNSLSASVTDMEKVISEASQTKGRFLAIISWIFEKKNMVLKILLLVAIFIIVPFTGYYIRTKWPNAVSDLADNILQLAAFLAGLTVMAQKALKSLDYGLSFIEQVKQNMIKVLNNKRENPSNSEVSLKEDIASLSQELKVSEGEFLEAKSQLRIKEADKDAFEKRISLGNFVSERSISIDYGKHLGLVTTIRKDFKMLIDKLENSGYQLYGKKVTRIVLYIDDLDRCQPDKVFEVLQAVHLLLAYKLFVVVVGVDPEWMGRSLESTYKQFQHHNNKKPHNTTPQNFIEKIFQIPFNLKPLSISGFPAFMEGLFNPALKPSWTGQETGESNTPKDVSEVGDDETNDNILSAGSEIISQENVGRVTSSGQVRSVAVTGDNPPGGPRIVSPGIVGQAIRSGKVRPIVISATNSARETPDNSEAANSGFQELGLIEQSLEIKEWEMAFAGKLHPFIQTPRTAKRFVNIYRLLKVGVHANELDAFEGTPYHLGLFQLPMVLLAIVVGKSEQAPYVLSYFYQNAKEGRDMLEALDHHISTGQKDSDLDMIATDIRSVIDGQWFPGQSDLVQKWAQEVSRFSFQAIKF